MVIEILIIWAVTLAVAVFLYLKQKAKLPIKTIVIQFKNGDLSLWVSGDRFLLDSDGECSVWINDRYVFNTYDRNIAAVYFLDNVTTTGE